MTIDRLILVLNSAIFFLIWAPIIIYIIRKRKNKPDRAQQTKEWTIEKAMQQVKEGEKPLFIGFSLTAEQYEELLPYIDDPDYLAMIQTRVEAE